jgi:hypothetical protein
VRCEWEVFDAFYLADPRRQRPPSVIGLHHRVFRDCYFRGIGVVVNQKTYDLMKWP